MKDRKFKDIVSKAITPIYLKKTLTEPTPNHPTEILKNLYLGNLKHAFHPEILQQLNISHIVNVSQTENVFENGLEEAFTRIGIKDTKYQLQPIEYYRISIPDKPEVHLCNRFRKVNEFIRNGLKSGSVLVHCHKGISRSSTIILGYLMEKSGRGLMDVYEYVNERHRIRPNLGFIRCLLTFEASLGIGVSGTVELTAIASGASTLPSAVDQLKLRDDSSDTTDNIVSDEFKHRGSSSVTIPLGLVEKIAFSDPCSINS